MYTVHFFVFALRLGSIFVKEKEKNEANRSDFSIHVYKPLCKNVYIPSPTTFVPSKSMEPKKNKSLLYSGDGERPHETLTTPHVPARETIWVLLQKKKKGEPKKKKIEIYKASIGLTLRNITETVTTRTEGTNNKKKKCGVTVDELCATMTMHKTSGRKREREMLEYLTEIGQQYLLSRTLCCTFFSLFGFVLRCLFSDIPTAFIEADEANYFLHADYSKTDTCWNNFLLGEPLAEASC